MRDQMDLLSIKEIEACSGHVNRNNSLMKCKNVTKRTKNSLKKHTFVECNNISTLHKWTLLYIYYKRVFT